MTTTQDAKRGVGCGLAAYTTWGFFPLYFHLLSSAGALEVVAHRVIWALVTCVLAVSVLHGWRGIATLRRPRTADILTLAALVLAANWGMFVYAVATGQVVQASLGYYINPLVTVALGVAVFHEHLRRAQWIAVGIGLMAVPP